jgi:hypothetical protein
MLTCDAQNFCPPYRFSPTPCAERPRALQP